MMGSPSGGRTETSPVSVALVVNGRLSRVLHHRDRMPRADEIAGVVLHLHAASRAETEAQLAGLPTNDKLIMFDRKREILLSMAENIERATPAQLQALVLELVERVETAQRAVTRVVWTPAARPFFTSGEVVADHSDALFWRPQGDSNP